MCSGFFKDDGLRLLGPIGFWCFYLTAHDSKLHRCPFITFFQIKKYDTIFRANANHLVYLAIILQNNFVVDIVFSHIMSWYCPAGV